MNPAGWDGLGSCEVGKNQEDVEVKQWPQVEPARQPGGRSHGSGKVRMPERQMPCDELN